MEQSTWRKARMLSTKCFCDVTTSCGWQPIRILLASDCGVDAVDLLPAWNDEFWEWRERAVGRESYLYRGTTTNGACPVEMRTRRVWINGPCLADRQGVAPLLGISGNCPVPFRQASSLLLPPRTRLNKQLRPSWPTMMLVPCMICLPAHCVIYTCRGSKLV